MPYRVAAHQPKDFSFEKLRIYDATVSGSYYVKQSLDGNINYPTLYQNISFVSAYSTDYELTPSLIALAGVYGGDAAVVGGTDRVALSIATSGDISGDGTSACLFRGTVVPRTRGNLYDISITFGGNFCRAGSITVNGIAYFDAASKRLWVAALNSDRSNGFIFLGTKP